MKSKQIFKVSVDIAMTAILIIMTAYHVTGSKLHEWLGAITFVLFILHHILNFKWYEGLFKGKYTAARVFITIVNLLLFISMAGMMISGIMLSREVFGFLNLPAGIIGRKLHMLSVSWGYVLISVHLGFHLRTFKSILSVKSKKFLAAVRLIIGVISCYGIYAFISRQFAEKMFLLVEYAFFDYDEPAIFFFADHICIMTLFAVLSYCLSKLLQKRKRSVSIQNEIL